MTVGRRGAVLGALALVMPLALARRAHATAPAESPEAFVADLAGRVLAIAGDPAIDQPGRLERIDRVTAGTFDLERTARLALGRFWKAASAAERQEFATLFKTYVLTSYGRRFAAFANRSLRVTGATPAGDDVVVTSLVEGGSTPVRLDWRLAAAGPGWRVLDLVVEGVSLLVTFRNEFAAVIERHGGRVAGLLADLRERVAAEQASLAG